MSGHGSQEQAPPEFWHLEPDHLNETLVCWDSRNPGGWDLADKELATLIAAVAEKSPHIAVILDCCHSSSGTRGELQETSVRRLENDRRQRPLESYVLSAETARSAAENPKSITLPEGRHVVVSACLDSEEAKEYYGDGQHRGAFSYFLMQSLQQASGSLSYRDLFKRANALVRTKISAQSPQLDATEADDLQQPFLGGAIIQSPDYFTVSHDRLHGWAIDGGGVHGIPQGSAEDCTSFALFPFDSSPAQLRNLQDALGWADVVEVLPHLSKVKLRELENPDPESTFKAVVTNLPLPAVGVYPDGGEEGVTLLRQALTQAGPGGEHPSLYVREVGQLLESRFRVLARQGEYSIVRPGDDRVLVAQIKGYSADGSPEQVVMDAMTDNTGISQNTDDVRFREVSRSCSAVSPVFRTNPAGWPLPRCGNFTGHRSLVSSGLTVL
ncbi:MAG: caspase family protein [bacterium]|nr:caspase family protein [bacterium]